MQWHAEVTILVAQVDSHNLAGHTKGGEGGVLSEKWDLPHVRHHYHQEAVVVHAKFHRQSHHHLDQHLHSHKEKSEAFISHSM